ncbi:MAG: hypothetical protein K0Q66_1099 [Chitinophagaceae bacterium]|jgi:hypothetical protein|nr:hypothetical protein [Chitinophagaceae bacterium]
MEKEEHIRFLREKYLQLSLQFLRELNSGKTLEELKDLRDVINEIVVEMNTLEESSGAETGKT